MANFFKKKTVKPNAHTGGQGEGRAGKRAVNKKWAAHATTVALGPRAQGQVGGQGEGRAGKRAVNKKWAAHATTVALGPDRKSVV